MKSKCRICLKEGKSFTDIFRKENSICIATQIMSIAEVLINVNDDLPTTICKLCIKKLNICTEFIKLCEKSDLELRLKVNTNIKSRTSSNNERYQNKGWLYETILDGKSNINDNSIDISHGGFYKSETEIKNVNSHRPFTSNNNSHDISQANTKHKVTGNNEILSEIKENQVNCEESAKKCFSVAVDAQNKKSIFNSKSNHTCDNQSVFDTADDNANNKFDPKLNKIKQSEVLLTEYETNYTISNNVKDLTIHDEKKKKIKRSRQYQCPTCGKTTSSEFRLKTHLATHLEERPFSCKYCEKKFSINETLKVHLRIHTGEKPLKCCDCGKKFAHSAGLVAHRRRHTGKMPYICNICPQNFRNYTSLQYHIRSHAGERNFECNVCNRAFITRGNLQLHLYTHTGEKPHACSYCSSHFSRVSNLKRHMRFVHKKEASEISQNVNLITIENI